MNNLNTFLTFDTSSKIWSVSLFVKGIETETIIRDSEISLSINLVAEIFELLKRNNIQKSDLECLGIATGPGSFTGLRVGLSVVKSLSKSIKIPWYGFNLFQITTLPATLQNKICFVFTNDYKVCFQNNSVFPHKFELMEKDVFCDKFLFDSRFELITTAESYKKIADIIDNQPNRIPTQIDALDSHITTLIGLYLLKSTNKELETFQNAQAFY